MKHLTIYHWIMFGLIGFMFLVMLVMFAIQMYGWWENWQSERAYQKYLKRHGR